MVRRASRRESRPSQAGSVSTAHLSKRLAFSDYRTLHGATLKTLPSSTAQQPSTHGLRMRHERFLAAETQRTDI